MWSSTVPPSMTAHYKVPEKRRVAKTPPLPPVERAAPWAPDPKTELIDPWRVPDPPNTGPRRGQADLAPTAPAAAAITCATGDFGEVSPSLDESSLGNGAEARPGRLSLHPSRRGNNRSVRRSRACRRLRKASGGPDSADGGVAGAQHRIRDQDHVQGRDHSPLPPAARRPRNFRPLRIPRLKLKTALQYGFQPQRGHKFRHTVFAGHGTRGKHRNRRHVTNGPGSRTVPGYGRVITYVPSDRCGRRVGSLGWTETDSTSRSLRLRHLTC